MDLLTCPHYGQTKGYITAQRPDYPFLEKRDLNRHIKTKHPEYYAPYKASVTKQQNQLQKEQDAKASEERQRVASKRVICNDPCAGYVMVLTYQLDPHYTRVSPDHARTPTREGLERIAQWEAQLAWMQAALDDAIRQAWEKGTPVTADEIQAARDAGASK